MNFYDSEHEDKYSRFLISDQTDPGDTERKAFFYLVALFAETRGRIMSLYDFKEHCIKVDGLNQGWQTGGTRAVTKLAFNLYNGFDGSDQEERCKVTPLEIFTSMSSEYTEFLFNAINIRLGKLK